jgi:phosphoadenosine phosphosulfate reductase
LPVAPREGVRWRALTGTRLSKIERSDIRGKRGAIQNVLNQPLQELDALLHKIAVDFAPAVFASSLGAEDMVITDRIYRQALPIGIFTLDTGRLPEETHSLMAAIGKHYGQRPQVYFPQTAAVEAYVASNGINAFYENTELRKACCQVRKVEPLRRALAGKKAWITGLRRGQSATRGEVDVEAFDTANGLMKFNPLADWSDAQVWDYLRAHHVPCNALHDRHYPSIGCAPCTRAIAVGEDIRAGRWWWEDAQLKECGLHPLPGAHAAAAQTDEPNNKRKVIA